MSAPASEKTKGGHLGRCFGIVSGKGKDAEVDGRLGVSLSPGHLQSNVHIPSLLRIHRPLDL